MTALTKEQVSRRQELTRKLADRTLTKQEAEELNGILEVEKKSAADTGDLIALLAIGFLAIAVVAFLSSLSGKKD